MEREDVTTQPEGDPPAVEAHVADDIGRLCSDLERLAERVYSEEGIPMVLVCENLVTDETAPALTQMNGDFAEALCRDIAAWHRLRPDAPVTDVAKIVEVLAERNFAAGGETQDL